MNKLLKTGFLLLFCFVFFTQNQSFSQEYESLLPTSLSDIQEWRPMGGAWVLGLDAKRRPSALYDLSYRYPDFRQLLGCLDLRCANAKQVARLIKNGRKFFKEIPSPLTPTGSLLDTFSEKEEAEATEVALQTLSEYDTQTTRRPSNQKYSVLPNDWWKKIPWKADTAFRTSSAGGRMDENPPSEFGLDDIDFEVLLGAQFSKFQEALKKLLKDEVSLEDFWLSSSGAGGYQIFFKPKAKNLTPPLPYKIADIRCPSCALVENLSNQVVQELISHLIGLIPVPAVSALVSTALHEWFHLKNGMTNFHQQRVFEMLAHGDQAPKPFTAISNLTPTTRESIAAYLVLSQMGVLGIVSWLIQDPSIHSFQWAVSQWKADQKTAETQAAQTAEYLRNRGMTLKYLNSTHVLASQKTEGKVQSWIYPLSTNRYWNLAPPFVAFDYQNPERIFQIRAGIEAAHLFIGILSSVIPVPFVGTAISQVFERVVHSQMHAVANWEARLDVVLETLSDSENRRTEMEYLRLQAVCPFIPTYALSLERTREERDFYHIP